MRQKQQMGNTLFDQGNACFLRLFSASYLQNFFGVFLHFYFPIDTINKKADSGSESG